MTPDQSAATSRQEADAEDRDELLVNLILEATSLTSIPDVFDRCVQQLSLAFGVHTAFISRSVPDQPGWTRLLAHWSDNEHGKLLQYDTVGTPCELLQTEPMFVHSDEVQSKFPEDKWLHSISARSYVALRLDGTDGKPLGHVGLVGQRPLHPTPSDLRRLRIVAAGIAGRLERERTEREMDRQLRQLTATAAELDQRNAELEASLNAFPDLRFVLASDGTYLNVWAGDEAQLVSPREEILGAKISDHFPDILARRIQDAIQKTLRTSEVTVVRYSIDHESGRAHYEARLAPLAPGQVIAVVRNVNDLMALEQQLVHAETMQSVGRLAGGVAHDFNNVLHVIRGHASSLSEQMRRLEQSEANPEDGYAMERRLGAIIRSVDRTTSLVDRLMAISRPAEDHPQPTVIDSFLLGLSSSLPQLLGERIAVELDLAATGVAVSIDASRFENAILNMVTNARDAMAAGGELKLSTSVANEQIVISITDTGVGIESSAVPKVFEPFFTTKPPSLGTGLGLATTYATIAAAGGSISVESALGTGSQFLIRLPTTTDETAHVDQLQAIQESSESNARVLVVEDEPDVLELCAEALRRMGCEVFAAVDGSEALKIFEHHPIDLVLTDVVMPNMSGPELASQLVQLAPDLAVIYMSGYASHELTDGTDAISDKLLRKPFTDAELQVAITSHLP